MFNTQTRTIYKWVELFRKHGVEGLQDKPKGHRKAILDDKHREQISNWIDSSKTPDGKPINWTLDTLSQYIKTEFGIVIKKSALSNTLRKMLYVIRKPRPTHANSTEEERSDYKKTLARLDALPDSSRKPVYFFDEGRFGLQSSLCRRWAKKGSQCTGKVKQSYQNFYVYSAVAPKDGDGFHLLLPFVNTEMMQIYLDELSLSLGEKEIILIMDQAGWHKSKALVVPENIEIWFLPAYSPELNPVERLWKMIKKNTLHNRLYDSLKLLEMAVAEYFDKITSEVLIRLCACSYI